MSLLSKILGRGVNEVMIIDLTQKSDAELEDMLLDLCGRLELDDEEVELLQAVEEERERRSTDAKRKIEGQG